MNLLHATSSLIYEGTLNTKEDWMFLTRFCYRKNYGEIEFYFEYPADYCCQELILYYDTQWPEVYPQEGKSCSDKRGVTIPRNRQTLQLNDRVWNSGCIRKTDESGNEIIVCSSQRQFRASRARWWYLVLANCGTSLGLKLKYKLTLTNGDSFWRKHFSADEQNILQTDIFFMAVLTLIFFISLYVAYKLTQRQLFHTTYKLYLWVIFFELISIGVNIGYYVEYGNTGKPTKSVKNIARAFHCLSEVLLVVLLILLGKGWTVTRGRISPAGQVKLSVFCTFYAVAYGALFIYEAKAFDPGQVLYLYESVAGLGLCILRIIAWLWFGYGVFFTLKNYRDKRYFYYPFYLFYTIWFLSGPIVVLVALYVIDAHVRAQVMNAVDRVVACMAATFFLALTRPSAANKNFPFHVRTSQIGILDDASSTDSTSNFDQHAYSPNDELELQEKKKDLAMMFAAKDPPIPSFRCKEEKVLSSIDAIPYNNIESPIRDSINTDLSYTNNVSNKQQNDLSYNPLNISYKPKKQLNSNLVNSSGQTFSYARNIQRRPTPTDLSVFSVMKKDIENIEDNHNKYIDKKEKYFEGEKEVEQKTPAGLFQASMTSLSKIPSDQPISQSPDEILPANMEVNSKKTKLPPLEINYDIPPLNDIKDELPPLKHVMKSRDLNEVSTKRGNALPPLKSSKRNSTKKGTKESIA